MTTIPEFMTPLGEAEPGWMRSWSEAPPRVSARSLLQAFLDSRTVYYPGSGIDGHPVSLLNRSHSAHCYIYVDYGIRKSELLDEIYNKGFRGYEAIRRVDLLMHDFEDTQEISEVYHKGPRPAGLIKSEPPYAFIQLFRRQREFSDAHGAEFFAILFLFADGHAAFEAIYARRRPVRSPFAVVLQDNVFGGNWASFGGSGPLHAVAQVSRRLPAYLLVAGNTKPWSGYVRSRDPSGVSLMQSPGGMHRRMRALWERSCPVDHDHMYLSNTDLRRASRFFWPLSDEANRNSA